MSLTFLMVDGMNAVADGMMDLAFTIPIQLFIVSPWLSQPGNVIHDLYNPVLISLAFFYFLGFAHEIFGYMVSQVDNENKTCFLLLFECCKNLCKVEFLQWPFVFV